MFNKLVPSGEHIIYRKAVWLYLFLLIFEGALRKWILPQFSQPLLLVRDPIVIWLVLVGFRKGWLDNGFVVIMVFASLLSFFMTLFVGHQNLLVALYGLRIYLFYFPFIFVIGRILTRDDILKMGRFILYLSIPMTILIVMQFYSPQSAWVNRGIGGNLEGAGFSGAEGFYRPPATFSFIIGFVNYQLLVCCFLIYYIMNNKTLQKSQQIKSWLLWLMMGCYIISLPYSISRSLLFQTCTIVVFVFIVGFYFHSYRKIIVRISVLVAILIGVILLLNITDDSTFAFRSRFESASEYEGGLKGTLVDRYLGSMYRGIFEQQNYNGGEIPFWGSGIGMGTNVAASLLNKTQAEGHNFLLAEEEWSRIVGESGFLLGVCIIVIRVLFSFKLFFKSFGILHKRKDMLPYIFSVAVLLTMLTGSMGASTVLGFMVLFGGVTLAMLKNNKIILKTRNYEN